MSTKTVLSSIAGLSLIAVSAVANAAATNPLSPSYQKFDVTINTPASANAVRYIDSANPLTSTYARIGDNSKWVTTTLRADQLYRDTANPLHPGFKRI
jgi:hypothetical protein